MNHDLQMRTAACPDYQRLLVECQTALAAWQQRSEEIIRLGLEGKSSGDGLQRLQAEYARAYNRLERHEDSCERCLFRPNVGKARPTLANSSSRREMPA